jgi:osmotically inducible protein OsmC
MLRQKNEKGTRMLRKSTAVWRGDTLRGSGALTTQSDALHDQPYSYKTRILSEDGKAGTNPEELLAAAHAGCYAMAASFALSQAGYPPDELRVTAAVELARVEERFVISSILLNLTGHVPGIDEEKFLALARAAEKDCPVSRALTGTRITLEAQLVRA